MTHSFLFQREPRWLQTNHVIRKTLPLHLQSWLNESESLTQRLRNQFENITVHVLFERQKSPFLTERRLLKQTEQRYCLVREVVLLSNQTPLILARTVIPEKTLKITQGNLARLGTRPLGEILFSAPSLERKPLGIALIKPNQWVSSLQISTPLWGRRTQYSIYGQPMLVSEFFLPSLFV
ncbi:MAG: chorismate lyase [Methylococcales bacterium]|nr:chorismate lyase [Methylococcales bacterium]MDD5754144.1 chorismate lyase [Methylococcales bacterium]